MDAPYSVGSLVTKWRPGLNADMPQKLHYIAIIGPTASGKSALAMKLAKQLEGEIVGCDSIQLYRGFDIGAAKPTLAERQEIPHHLIDCVDWTEDYDASRYRSEASAIIQEINARGKLAIVVGGTGLYLRFLWGLGFHNLPSDVTLRQKLAKVPLDELREQLCQLDPKRALEIHPNDQLRTIRAVELNQLTGKTFAELQKSSGITLYSPEEVHIVTPPRRMLHQRIALRTQKMLAAGLIDEARTLVAAGCATHAKPMQSIGYRQVVDYLSGTLPFAKLEQKIIEASRQYAKRQITWTRSLYRQSAAPSLQITQHQSISCDSFASMC